MDVRQWVWCVAVAGGLIGMNSCSGGEAPSSEAPPGGLPCEGLAIDCRLAFSGDYEGTFSGDDSGTLSIYVNVIGGVSGTASGAQLGSQDVTGQVNEFGALEFTAADGTVFNGQFNQDKISFSGTWQASGVSANGTFMGQNILEGEPMLDGGTGPGPNAPDLETLTMAAATACQTLLTCGAAADCSEDDPINDPNCGIEELAFYDCISMAGCDYETACLGATDAFGQCQLDNVGGPGEGEDFNPPLTGEESFDLATHVCSACTQYAEACYEAQSCRDFAGCLDACTGDSFECQATCEGQYPEGAQLFGDSVSCSLTCL